MSRIIIWIIIIFILSGCTLITSQLPSAEEIGLSYSSSVASKANRYNDLTPGAQVKISDPTFPEQIKATVGQEYQSALGINCYQLKAEDAALVYEPIALCQSEAGAWFIAPRIWAHSTSGSR